MTNVKHSSETTEHSTPSYIVDPARELLVGIDLDPASSALFNKHVKASNYFNSRKNGLKQEWFGHVFLNPPGGLCDEDGRRVIYATKSRPGCKETGECGLKPGHSHIGVMSSAKKWWFTMASKYMKKEFLSGFFVGFSLELLQTTQSDPALAERIPMPLDFPCCYPSKRIPFLAAQGSRLIPQEQPTHANVLVYLPERWVKAEEKKFEKLFSPIGRCVWPSKRVRR